MLHVKQLSYEIDGHEVFRNVSFSVNENDRIGLVGKNGVGKTTLLRAMAGQVLPSEGRVVRDDVEVGLMPQSLEPWHNVSVFDFLESVTGVKQAREEFDAACVLLETDTGERALEIYAEALEKYEKYGVASFDALIERSLSAANMNAIDVSSPLKSFSGGQKTRIALAAIFASQQDLILLDEPTNNLDTKGIEALEQFIDTTKSAFVMVSHDRRFLRDSTNRIVELLGDARGTMQYSLGYDEYMDSRQAGRDAVNKRYDQYETEKRRLQKAERDMKIRANGANGASKRKPDNDKTTANFRAEKAASGLGRAAQGVGSRLEQLQEPERPEEEVSLNFLFKDADKKKLSLLSVDNLVVEYPGFTTRPLSLHVRSGERYAINGTNGAGKTSLLKAIMGKSDGRVTGSISINKESRPIYIDQNQTPPLPNGTAYDNIKHLAPHLEEHDARNLLIRFNLNKEVITTTKAAELSGGERAKVLLASIAANQTNLLILDEPTNNLDIPTVEAFERAIDSYGGGVVVVSHDREFLDHINVTHEITL